GRRLLGGPGRLDPVEAEGAPAASQPAPPHQVPLVAGAGEPERLDQAALGAVAVPVDVLELDDLAAEDGRLHRPHDRRAGQLALPLEQADPADEVARALSARGGHG